MTTEAPASAVRGTGWSWLLEHGFVRAENVWSRGEWRVYDYGDGWRAVHVAATARGTGETPDEALGALAGALRRAAWRMRVIVACLSEEADAMEAETRG